MKSIIFALAILFSASCFAAATTDNSVNPITTCLEAPQKVKILPATTQVNLKSVEIISTSGLTEGRTIRFRTILQVKVSGDIFINADAYATGEVQKIMRSSYNEVESVMIRATSVRGVDGTTIKLDGVQAVFLGENTGEGVDVLPLQEMEAFVLQDTEIDVK